MRIPLRYRVAALTFLCLAPVVGVSSVALVQVAKRYFWQEAADDLASFAGTVRRATRHAMLSFDRAEVGAILDAVARTPGVRAVRLYDGQGRLRLPAGRPGADLDPAGPRCTRCHPAKGGFQLPPGGCLDPVPGGLRLYAAIPNEPACSNPSCHAAEDPVLGVLEVEKSVAGLTEQVGRLAAQAAVWGLVVLGAAVGPLFLVFGWAFERPLRECLRLVRALERGRLDARTRLQRADEWGELLAAFDSMAHALEHSQVELEALNRGLEEQVEARTRELERALEAAQESDRMKTEFLAGISHELSTPLQAVIGYAQLLLDGIDGELRPEQRRDVERILRNGQKLHTLVENLLELARIEGHRRLLCVDRIRVEDVAHEVAEAGRKLAAGRPVAVVLDSEPGLPAVLGEARALRHILFNLVDNAVRHTHRGQVLIQVGRAGEGWVEVSVADTGPGMDADGVRSALRGLAPKKDGGGVGVGLALARRLVELHGGHFSLESTPGSGTRVSVRLPAEGPDGPSGSAPQEPVGLGGS